MGFFPESLVLLADAAEMVSTRPALWCSPLELEIQRTFVRTALPGSKITGKRSPRARRTDFQKLEAVLLHYSNSRGRSGDKCCDRPQPGTPRRVRKRKRSVDRDCGSVSAAFGKELPFGFLSKIHGDLSGTNVKLVMEKKLTASDMNPNLGRFSLPSSQVLSDFLDQGEEQFLQSGVMTVPVVEPHIGVSDLALKRWKMSTKPTYVLTSGWNNVVLNNNLRPGDPIQVWSFRTEGRIGFAIVKCADNAVTAAAGDHQEDVGSCSSRRPPSPSSVLDSRLF